jgi:hypothetical protein
MQVKNCILAIFCLYVVPCWAQNDDFFQLPLKKQEAFIRSVSEKSRKLDEKIASHTKQTLAKLKKQEYKLYKKLYKKDSIAAKQFLENSEAIYSELEAKLDKSHDAEKKLKEYIPAFDTLKSSLAFLNKNIEANHPLTKKLNDAGGDLRVFETRLQVANEIKRQLKERRKQLAQQFEPLGFGKELKKIGKDMFYYQEQLKEFKAILSDPKKIEQKAIAVLRKSSFFKEFMKKHSMLADLFRLPDNYGSPQSLAGLQTSASVEAALLQKFAGAEVNPQEHIQQKAGQANNELNKLKKKIGRVGGGSSSDIDMPEGFKPNTQKTKSFIKRFEYGANFQTQRLNNYFPVTTDIALTVGYKLNDKSVIGIAASYKLGLGEGIEKVRLTNEGLGLRSYIDWKLKGGLWITGGYEQNYYHRFIDLRQIRDISVWRQSGLLGLTKKIKVGKKTSNVQLLYDFFHLKDNLHTQPLLFRVGYKI